jgi:saccharopine dehydrogenase-like NADP-dependent oxidoreductase
MMKNVCIFGSGMVSKPAVEFFAQKDDFNITLASKFTKDLDDVAGNIPGVRKAVIDAKDEAGVRKLLKDQDVVISLLPVMLHPKIATAAIATKTHFVSTSYVTKEMGLLSDNAKAAGIILLNECGLGSRFGSYEHNVSRQQTQKRGENHHQLRILWHRFARP